MVRQSEANNREVMRATEAAMWLVLGSAVIQLVAALGRIAIYAAFH